MRHGITVQKLIEALQKENPDAICVVAGRDHSYRRIPEPVGSVAALEDGRHLSEWSGDADDYDCPVVQIPVVILGG